MKKPLLMLALGLSTILNSAYAATYAATPSGDGYQFSSSFAGDTNFDDYISFSTTGFQNIVASISGSSSNTFTFNTFNLLDSDKTLVATGTVLNGIPQVSFGFLTSAQIGTYYLHVVGNSTGATTGYNGTISTTTAVPEPGNYALMLAGLGLVGVIARKKMRDNV
ncbi:MAG: FxDxF family PEP-CTERM protein [Methylophilus sp.]|uniref:FxDxF family PEP-CTERM protein n=1 Tax=Methylophilus sp. TaxID=29541 RepID=UPI003FA06A71